MTCPGVSLFLTPPQLEMQPPQLVRQEVEDMRAKTVFQDKLDPIQCSTLGMAFEKLVPM